MRLGSTFLLRCLPRSFRLCVALSLRCFPLLSLGGWMGIAPVQPDVAVILQLPVPPGVQPLGELLARLQVGVVPPAGLARIGLKVQEHPQAASSVVNAL